MKKKTLEEHSKNYTIETGPYEALKRSEDSLGVISSFLKQEIKNKVILDIGCGNGTDTKRFASSSKHYYALDSSSEQLKIAKEKCLGLTNITFLQSSGEKINLPENSIDLVICAWVISVIRGRRRKSAVLAEAERVLKPGGKIVLVENDWHGEFEEIRMHPKRTKHFNNWLVKKGFTVEQSLSTYFKFPSREIAQNVFDQIWGKRVSSKIKSEKILHKVLIFTKKKSLSKQISKI